MSHATLLVRTVSVLRAATTTNRYNDSAKNWDSTTSWTVNGWLAQQSTSETLDHREAVSQGLILHLDADTEIAAGDRVRIDGVTYDVAGEPNVAWTPRGAHHIECQLTVVVG
jgi:head-tail adaptor